MSIKRPAHRKISGNTMTEYLFIAFLVLMLSFGTWMAIGQGLNGMATRLKGEFKQKSELAAAKRTALSNMPTGPTGINLSQNPVSPNGTLLNCDFVKRVCLTPPPPSFTAGGNGNEMHAFIINMITNLLKSIGIDVKPDPDAVLTRMSINGHKISFLQKVMEALKGYSAEDQAKLKDTVIQIEGKSYKVQELIDILKGLTSEVKNDKEKVADSNLPEPDKETVDKEAETIVDSGEQTSTEMQNTLNTPAPPTPPEAPTEPAPGTSTSDPYYGAPTTQPPPATSEGDPTESPPDTGDPNAQPSGGSGGNTSDTGINRQGTGPDSDTPNSDLSAGAAKRICKKTEKPENCTPQATSSPTGETTPF